MDVGPAYERGGARGGRTSDRASADSGDIGCCGATLIVARIQFLEGSDPPSGRHQPTCPPAAARPPRILAGAVGLLSGPRRTHVPTPPTTSSKPETFREGTAGRAPALAAQDTWADESLQSSTFMPGAPNVVRQSRWPIPAADSSSRVGPVFRQQPRRDPSTTTAGTVRIP